MFLFFKKFRIKIFNFVKFMFLKGFGFEKFFNN